MKRLMFGVLAFALFACPAYSPANPPGPTTAPFGTFEVVDEQLAAPVERIDLPATADSSSEDLIFPQTLIGAGQMVAWKINTETGAVTPYYDNPPQGLSETQQQAVLAAPTWLQLPLLDRFLGLGEDDAEVFAELILNPEEQRYTDELAFLVAMMGEYDLKGDNIDLLLEQIVRLIYETDQLVQYARVVDDGVPGDGDYWTTVEYDVLVDGKLETFTLPPEVYYDYIVHPKLDQEQVRFIEPHTGYTRDPDDGGVFWRSYFLYDAPGADSYTTPYFMRNPNPITAPMLQDWGDSAAASIAARSLYNIDAAYHENDDPVLVEFSYGRGTVLVTTLNLETACGTGHCELLDNLLAYGPGDMDLALDSQVALVVDDDKKAGAAALVTGRLADLGFAHVKVLGASQYQHLMPSDLAGYAKIVVPGGQSFATYRLVSQDPNLEHPAIHSWVSGGYRVLQLHLTGPDDLSALEFVGGHQVSAPDPTNTIVMGGRPLLSDVIANADHLWDGEAYPSLSGDRSLDSDGTMALRLIGNWVGKNMLDNVQEYSDKNHITSFNVDRSIQPAQIIWNHWGNCGELQDVVSAAMRTCLIPALNVSDINEDHVWNEFFHDGDWYYLQNDWSNGPTRIATPGGGQDTDYGGGKTTSFIFGWDGNGEIFSVIDRYSETVTLKIELTDAAGQPVPGARVWIGSEGYYSGSNNWSFYLFTDEGGKGEVTLGDNRNYYLRLDSAAGSYPDTSQGHATQVIRAEQALPGKTFTFAQQLDEVLQGQSSVVEPDESGRYGLRLAFDIHQRFQHLSHPFNRVEFTRFPQAKGVNVYLVNQANFEKCRKGENNYQVAQVWEGVTAFDETVYPPEQDGPWWIVVSNKTNPESTITLDYTVGPVEESDDDDDDSGGDDDDDDDDDGCGCGC